MKYVALLVLAAGLAAPPAFAQTIREIAPGVTRIDTPPNWGGSFGHALAVRGSLAVVGSPDETHRPGAASHYAGAVHLFRHDGAVWHHEARLTAWDDTTAYGEFGKAVDVSEIDGVVTVAVGAPGHSAYEVPNKAGRVFLFRHEAGRWRPDTVLTGFGPYDWFGGSLSLDGARLAVGQYGRAQRGGAAYVFERVEGAWRQAVRFVGSNFYDRLGNHVSVSGDLLLIKSKTPEFDEGRSYVLRRDADGAWRRDVRMDSLVYATRDGARVGASWLSGNRLYTTAGRWDAGARAHPIVLARGEAGWTVEADLFDPELHYALDNDRGNPFEGDHVVVASAHGTPEGTPRYRPAAVYRRSGETWRQVARLPIPDGDPMRSGLLTTAVGPDGRFVAAEVHDAGVDRIYLFELARIAVAAEPEPAASAPGVRVFPLPARTNVTVVFSSDAPGLTRLRLFDLTGREVHARDHPGGVGEQRAGLDVSALPAGVYVLRVETPTHTRPAPVLVR